MDSWRNSGCPDAVRRGDLWSVSVFRRDVVAVTLAGCLSPRPNGGRIQCPLSGPVSGTINAMVLGHCLTARLEAWRFPSNPVESMPWLGGASIALLSQKLPRRTAAGGCWPGAVGGSFACGQLPLADSLPRLPESAPGRGIGRPYPSPRPVRNKLIGCHGRASPAVVPELAVAPSPPLAHDHPILKKTQMIDAVGLHRHCTNRHLRSSASTAVRADRRSLRSGRSNNAVSQP